MTEQELYASLIPSVVINPLLNRLEEKDSTAAKTLRNGFRKVEQSNPGFCHLFVKKILEKCQVEVDFPEVLLRLEALPHHDEYLINKSDDQIVVLNGRSTNLKKILTKVPDEIRDRKKFLETIKDIATAIRLLLDSVNSLLNTLDNTQKLDQQKKSFVKYSRNFSNTLKDFFRDNEKREVFISANHLINQSNILMSVVKETIQ